MPRGLNVRSLSSHDTNHKVGEGDRVLIDGKRVLAVVPARGGSKGIPGKNLVPLCGKPLLQWTIEAAQKSRYVDRLVLSSDDETICNVGQRLGCDVPFKRPKILASDAIARVTSDSLISPTALCIILIDIFSEFILLRLCSIASFEP